MLSINAITVRLGGRLILDHASAALPPGSRVGLIGRNGAGKSTLMKVVAGLLEADEGSAEMPKAARLGYIAQETPAGPGTPFETVLAADTERAALLHEAETNHEPHRLGEIHERLNAIGAHAAPARAARILVGLGFDEAAQQRPLDSFSGGWRMRVALAALLFSQPDLLLLDEPSQPSRSRGDALAGGLPSLLQGDDADRQPRARSAQQCRRSHSSPPGRQDHALRRRL